MDTIPCPDVTRYNGVLNLAAHLPKEGPSPDLGKFYVFIMKTILSGERTLRAQDV